MSKILIVDDEELVLKGIQRELRNYGSDLECFSDPLKALSFLETTQVDLIISDYRMPGIDGVEFLTRAKKCQPDAMRIIVSGHADLQFLRDAINKAEIYRFLVKPWDAYELNSAIIMALEFKKVLTENKQLADQVRDQQGRLDVQQKELQRLEQQHPGITQVNWDNDGAIVLDEISMDSYDKVKKIN